MVGLLAAVARQFLPPSAQTLPARPALSSRA